MAKREWSTGKPPNEVIVEALSYEGKVHHVMAFYGRDGTRPHWRTKDGSEQYPVDYFTKWREVR